MTTWTKLQPDRDLQCYFERPSAIAAMSGASPSGFVLSGTFRQPFDWAVVEWNRDNNIEHPAFRPLPDGDLRGLTLRYREKRFGCMTMDSSMYPTVDWPFLRIWTEVNGQERFHRVKLREYAVATQGDAQAARVTFELQGSPTSGDYVGLSLPGEHHTYQLLGADTISSTVARIAESVNSFSPRFTANAAGTTITVECAGAGAEGLAIAGANGNRLGAYGFVAGAQTESWVVPVKEFTGGASPSQWELRLPLGELVDEHGVSVPVHNVRKMRWTYAAEFMKEGFEEIEFRVELTDWEVSGAGKSYRIAGPGSRRYLAGDREVERTGPWTREPGNFYGGELFTSSSTGAKWRVSYAFGKPHVLLLGTRVTPTCADLMVRIDGGPAQRHSVARAGEDNCLRVRLAALEPGRHTVEISHAGPSGNVAYLNYVEAAIPTENLPEMEPDSVITLATDWDTDHSLSIPPERALALINELGFRGRLNHYVGAMWFYQMERAGHHYASVRLQLGGTPVPSSVVTLTFGLTSDPVEQRSAVHHVVRVGDSVPLLAQTLAMTLNSGYTAVRAEAGEDYLDIIARLPGNFGNSLLVNATCTADSLHLSLASPTLQGGQDGRWITEVTREERMNRACRDWSVAFFKEARRIGLESVAAFSLELQHGDDTWEAGIAQRYPDGAPTWLNTPALQTNFSPASLAYWRGVHRDMAGIMVEAGVPPLLQFGEVQWWYFPSHGGMPFYDEWTMAEFQRLHGRQLPVLQGNEPAGTVPAEVTAFLAGLVGEFTEAVIAHVRQFFPEATFEVLYPTDVNDRHLAEAVNLPRAVWGPDRLSLFKTESFTYTGDRKLDSCQRTIEFGRGMGYSPERRSFLVGISDPSSTWRREVQRAVEEGIGNIVLFALDQYCLVGYPSLTPDRGSRSAWVE